MLIYSIGILYKLSKNLIMIMKYINTIVLKRLAVYMLIVVGVFIYNIFNTYAVMSSYTGELSSTHNVVNIQVVNSFDDLSIGHVEDMEIDPDVDNLMKFLVDYGSPIAEYKYAKIIVDVSKRYGADYKLNVAIMLAESGVCKNPHKKYNCYGFLDGVYYESFEDSLTTLTAKVSNMYTGKYGNDIVTIARRYGPVNKEAWIRKINYAMNRIDN